MVAPTLHDIKPSRHEWVVPRVGSSRFGNPHELRSRERNSAQGLGQPTRRCCGVADVAAKTCLLVSPRAASLAALPLRVLGDPDRQPRRRVLEQPTLMLVRGSGSQVLVCPTPFSCGGAHGALCVVGAAVPTHVRLALGAGGSSGRPPVATSTCVAIGGSRPAFLANRVSSALPRTAVTGWVLSSRPGPTRGAASYP